MTKATPLVLLLGTALFTCATVAAPQTRAEYDAGRARIDDTYKAERAVCASFTANARDVCVEEGRARQKVARAALAYGYTGTVNDQNKLWVSKAEAAYAVARERCDDQTGNAKAVCRKHAKTVEVKALADAKHMARVGDAKTEADADTRDADYEVTARKCDGMTVEMKSSCVAATKLRFGKV